MVARRSNAGVPVGDFCAGLYAAYTILAAVRQAEATGRHIWSDATWNGEDILGRTQSELTALGAGQIRSVGNPSSSTAGPNERPWLDRSPAAKLLGGQLAENIGRGFGLGRGIGHSIEGAARTAPLLEMTLDPTNLLKYAPAIDRILNLRFELE